MEIKQQVENLITEIDSTHRYSMSRIYALYNQVFETDETPQACASCLIRKVNKLRTWLNIYAVETPRKKRKISV
ncbi:hypothetical protein [Viscerimonas tarda]